jgi:four helix bundle protein
MRVTRFEDLAVWKKSKDLSLRIYRVSSKGELARDWGLKDQIRRATVSVMSNIAEGFERYSANEFRHFVSIARGSAAEVRTQLYLARDLNYIPQPEAAEMLELCLEISRMLAALHTRTASRS